MLGVWSGYDQTVHMGMMFLVCFLLAYFIECKKSHTLGYLSNMVREPKKLARRITDLIKYQPPCIMFHVCCSHTTTTHDSDGGSHTTTHITHSSNHAVEFTCTDESDFGNLSEAEVENAIAQWGSATQRALIEIDSTWSIRDGDGSLAPIKSHLWETHKHLDHSCHVTMRPDAPKPVERFAGHPTLHVTQLETRFHLCVLLSAAR